MTADRNLAIFQLIVIVIGEVLICAIMNGQGLSSIIIRGPVVTLVCHWVCLLIQDSSFLGSVVLQM